MHDALSYLKQSKAATEQVARMGGLSHGYHRKLASANSLVLQAFELEGEPGVRELLASLRRTAADDIVVIEAERLYRAIQVRI